MIVITEQCEFIWLNITKNEFVAWLQFGFPPPSGSGSQDIRNIIPFSGKGFLLGGKCQSSTSSSPSHKPPVPVVKTSFSSPISSPKKLFTPSSPAKSVTSPERSVPDSPTKGISTAFPFVRPTTSTGQKPTVKRSISNTRIFVNINGSPVRIPKPHGSSSSSPATDEIRQRSIQDLFGSTDLRKSVSQSSNSNAETKRDSLTSPKSTVSATSASSFVPKQQSSSSSSTSNPSKSSQSKYPPVASAESSPAEQTQSRYFTDSNCDGPLGAAGGGQRKRPRDDRSSSTSIFDFFQKTLASDSTTRRESIKTKSPAMQQRTATTSSSTSTASHHSSAGLHSVTSSSSSFTSALMVSCPVCQAKVQESKINEHLDSCLSWARRSRLGGG